MRLRAQLPPEIEEFRDERWGRESTRQVESAYDAERFIDRAGFAACMTDSRRPGPSLYVAVCGRRDAVMPRTVQTDPEASQAWLIKDDLVRRGKVYYAKLAGGRATFIAPRMIRYFHALWGVRRAEESHRLSRPAQAVLRVLRREWEIATSDLRADSGVADRVRFARALDELQAARLVVPSEVYYQPKFTYLWTLAVGRFAGELRRRTPRAVALREIARCFLLGAAVTVPGELARVTGLSRPDAGLGNRALVAEGFATSPSRGVYVLASGLPPASPPGTS
ncbi:MAG: AlkZ-related protein [Vicinamibacterales bacterium]